ncbi:diadenosine tetraphosphate (Ap4A) hydrolase-like HIT family hydrolase [Legionella birminghamensis]|uniref:Diadenosine tetraphosphate (Ap4A) hydrolase-like HIT family hydrolase n=1 Tax=Legionella birminghamensis TaxID=28083 RepID=A0A378I952_9GAMM|nr:HIT domain-containing protein [Legionella birminghamensis]KTC68139.1 diadenosine tetraphosphate (Ap4A) hydrolase-like HIT family hydrolase [Legionella birminghamensis]STX31151.1 diadenosine tetraphosphate (Ap4A) hydrolase-like HIT family hydrolase [Legionella birminghamensis]
MFSIDARILSTSVFLYESHLSTVLVKNDSQFPWLLLIPRVYGVEEMIQLPSAQQTQLMGEIAFFSRILQSCCQPDKLNIAALGNIVSQLHIHILARYKTDNAWPHSVWQASITPKPYNPEELAIFISRLQEQIERNNNQRSPETSKIP